MINRQRESTAETIAAAAKLAAPERIWRDLIMGHPYVDRLWEIGLNGSVYNPDRLGCDWLIRLCREMGVEPTVRLLKLIEKIIREERK